MEIGCLAVTTNFLENMCQWFQLVVIAERQRENISIEGLVQTRRKIWSFFIHPREHKRTDFEEFGNEAVVVANGFHQINKNATKTLSKRLILCFKEEKGAIQVWKVKMVSKLQYFGTSHPFNAP